MSGINKEYFIEHFYLKDDGTFPNSHLPVIHYKGILKLPVLRPSAYIKRLFKKNDWENSWAYGIYTYHHYHSITHEVLAVYKGETILQFGGEKGAEIKVQKGDVVIIPAGVAHKNLGEEKDVLVVGAYPDGRDYDMNYGNKGERPQTDRNIAKLAVPVKDPVFGLKDGLRIFWK